jgi:hypothetical protein
MYRKLALKEMHGFIAPIPVKFEMYLFYYCSSSEMFE